MSIPIIDVFNQNAFGVISLTEAINDITPQYGYLGALGLFQDEGVMQRSVAVDFDPITNQLLPQSQWGGPGVANKTAVGRSRSYSIPHFNPQDAILAADLMGRRQPGTDAVQTAQWLMGKKLREMKLKLEQTLEWMRLGVLKNGNITDGAGNVILNVYTDFGISQTSTSLVLATTTTNVLQLISQVKRNSLAALRGELMNQFVALCSDTFFDALTSHPNVKQAFQFYQNRVGQNLAEDYSAGTARADANGLFARNAGFTFGDVTFINYTGAVTDSTGASQTMIDSGSAYLFPTGTSVFKTWFAPADYMETVNTEGVPFYAKQIPMEFDKGIKVECQSNPLPICLKPAVIQKLTT